MTTLDQPLRPLQETKSASLEEQRVTLRDRLKRRFEVWLDEALAPEAVPQGLAADILGQLEAETPGDASSPTNDQDLQAVCTTLVGLTDTARHQSEAFQQLRQDLPPVQALAEAVSSLMTSLASDRESQEQERQQQEEKQRLEARRQIFQEVLGTVMDMRDRMREGLTEAQTQLDAIPKAESASKKRLWPISSKMQSALSTSPGHAGLETLIKANQLALDSIDQTLTRWHVKLVEGVGLPMDGETMKIVDQMIKPDVTEGTVLKVLRTGYIWNSVLCRPAEVCVVQSTESH